MARNIGRPAKPDDKRKKVISISLDLADIAIIDALGAFYEHTRSQTVRKLIRDAKLINSALVSEDDEHMGPSQGYTLPKTKLQTCNPYLHRGRCQHPVCQAAYAKEGL